MSLSTRILVLVREYDLIPEQLKTHQASSCLSEQSRRDDLESLAYILLYFLRGSLPWQGLKSSPEEKFDRIKDKKMSIPVDVLCSGLPEEFSTFLNYCRALDFKDKPNYTYLRKLFRDMAAREGYEYDNQYDWSQPPQAKPREQPRAESESTLDLVEEETVKSSPTM